MKKIKFFNDVREEYLERQVNVFLERLYSLDHAEVIDVRYNTYINEHGHDTWSVMVIYEV